MFLKHIMNKRILVFSFLAAFLVSLITSFFIFSEATRLLYTNTLQQINMTSTTFFVKLTTVLLFQTTVL